MRDGCRAGGSRAGVTAGWSFTRQMAGTAAAGTLGGLLGRWAGPALDTLDRTGGDGPVGVTARDVAAGAIGDLFLLLAIVAALGVAAAVSLQEGPTP